MKFESVPERSNAGQPSQAEAAVGSAVAAMPVHARLAEAIIRSRPAPDLWYKRRSKETDR